jgi:branched-chain amino acid transport system substrate-binding protein
MIGPLLGDEGIAVKNYAKTKPDITFINGSSARRRPNARRPGTKLLPLQQRRRAVDGRLGEHALSKGYKRCSSSPRTTASRTRRSQGFMASYCAKGGKVVDKAWVPLGTKDYASVIAKIPKDIDALFVVPRGTTRSTSDPVRAAGGNNADVGGSITVDQTCLNYKGKRRESLLGTASAGRWPTRSTRPSGRSSSPTTRRSSRRLPEPSLFAYLYYINTQATLNALDAVKANLRTARRRTATRCRRPLPWPGRRDQDRRQPQRRRHDLHHEVTKAPTARSTTRS